MLTNVECISCACAMCMLTTVECYRESSFALINANSLNRPDTGRYVMLGNSHKVVFPYKNESKENKYLTVKHNASFFLCVTRRISEQILALHRSQACGLTRGLKPQSWPGISVNS